MSTFTLEIMTPERYFFQGEAESLRVDCTDGQLAVLKGHCPMLAALPVGELSIRLPDETEPKSAVHAEGFVEVRPDRVLVFVQSCEWPDEIDIKRAQEAADKANEKLRQQQSLNEHRHTQISLARAMARLRVTKSNRFDQ